MYENIEEGFSLYMCSKRFLGFLTDREQRKVWGVGVLYILGFPILCCTTFIGGLEAYPYGEPNPNCPAEPNMPWFLITGGIGIGVLLLLRIALNKFTSGISQSGRCCHVCEFSCNLLYDIFSMSLIIMWLITVTWWVFRHRIGPTRLNSLLGSDIMENFRHALGDNDKIHLIQFTNQNKDSYCDKTLFMFGFFLLCLGWIILLGAVLVFLVDKIVSKIVCCRLCRNMNSSSDDDKAERVFLNKNIIVESAVEL